METLPRWRVPPAPPRPAPGLDGLAWDEVPAFALLTRADGGGPPAQGTTVRVCRDDSTLYVRFDCADRDAWGTFEHRDDPIYQEEAVELFLAPGPADPVRYFEFELSPRGVLFDALIHNPTSQRADMTADATWDCSGILWATGRGGLGRVRPAQATGSVGGGKGGAHTKESSTDGPGQARGANLTDDDWWAALAIPWTSLTPADPLPLIWRANFYRIERPRDAGDAAAEFSCWSPTLTDPADFHKPARFGALEL